MTSPRRLFSSSPLAKLPLATSFILLFILGGLWLGNAPETLADAPPDSLSAPQLAALLHTPSAPLVLDVRSPREFQQGHIPSAINIPYRQLPNHLDELAAYRTRLVVVYCEVGIRAAIAEATLTQAGFTEVLPLVGDIRGWQQAGFPLETVSPQATP